MAQGDRPGKQPFDPAKADQVKSDFLRGAKYAPFDLVGAPVDLTTMAMRSLGVPVPEKPFLSSEYLIDKYADLGEALDINYDRPTGSGMETLGRVMAGTAGLGGEAIALAPGIGRVFAQTTKARGSGAEVKGSGAAQLETPTSDRVTTFTPGKYDEFFESMGEEGAGMEFPAVGQAVDSYVMEFDPKKSFDLLDGALKSEDYPGYATALRANLDRQFPGDKISVSRTENYSDPQAGIEGRRSKSFFEVDKDDVLFAGSDSERELIIRGPEGTYNEGGPMSVRIEEAPSSDLPDAPQKEVLEGEVVGSKSKKYMDLQKQVDEASSPDLRAARELNMETQGVKDAFDLNAASNIDKNFEFASGGDEVRSTADEFIDGVIDEFQGARDQGFSRGEALIDAVRVKVNDYNDIYPDALDVNSVLDDIAKNVNEDFGFDDALSRFRKAQTNQKSLQDQAQTAKYQRIAEEQAAARRVQEEQLGIADLSDADKAAFYRNMAQQDQSGIAGAGIPDPQPPKPNLRLVKKAAGGPVDLRSGIGNVFKLYS